MEYLHENLYEHHYEHLHERLQDHAASKRRSQSPSRQGAAIPPPHVFLIKLFVEVFVQVFMKVFAEVSGWNYLFTIIFVFVLIKKDKNQ